MPEVFELRLEVAPPTFRQRLDPNRTLQPGQIILFTRVQSSDIGHGGLVIVSRGQRGWRQSGRLLP